MVSCASYILQQLYPGDLTPGMQIHNRNPYLLANRAAVETARITRDRLKRLKRGIDVSNMTGEERDTLRLWRNREFILAAWLDQFSEEPGDLPARICNTVRGFLADQLSAEINFVNRIGNSVNSQKLMRS